MSALLSPALVNQDSRAMPDHCGSHEEPFFGLHLYSANVKNTTWKISAFLKCGEYTSLKELCVPQSGGDAHL